MNTALTVDAAAETWVFQLQNTTFFPPLPPSLDGDSFIPKVKSEFFLPTKCLRPCRTHCSLTVPHIKFMRSESGKSGWGYMWVKLAHEKEKTRAIPGSWRSLPSLCKRTLRNRADKGIHFYSYVFFTLAHSCLCSFLSEGWRCLRGPLCWTQYLTDTSSVRLNCQLKDVSASCQVTEEVVMFVNS